MKSYLPPHIREKETRYKRLRFSFFVMVTLLLVSSGIYGIFFNPKLLVSHIVVSGFDQSLVVDIEHILKEKRIMRDVVSGNNILFITQGDFDGILRRHSEINTMVMKKDYIHSTLLFDIQTRVLGGVWCNGDRGDTCLVFDTDGVLFMKQENTIASSSFPLLIEDSDRFPVLLSPHENKQKPIIIGESVVDIHTLKLFRDFIQFLGVQGMRVKTIIRRDKDDLNILLELDGGEVILVDRGRGFEETKNDFLRAKNKLPHSFEYIDLRIPARVYFK